MSNGGGDVSNEGGVHRVYERCDLKYWVIILHH